MLRKHDEILPHHFQQTILLRLATALGAQRDPEEPQQQFDARAKRLVLHVWAQRALAAREIWWLDLGGWDRLVPLATALGTQQTARINLRNPVHRFLLHLVCGRGWVPALCKMAVEDMGSSLVILLRMQRLAQAQQLAQSRRIG